MSLASILSPSKDQNFLTWYVETIGWQIDRILFDGICKAHATFHCCVGYRSMPTENSHLLLHRDTDRINRWFTEEWQYSLQYFRIFSDVCWVLFINIYGSAKVFLIVNNNSNNNNNNNNNNNTHIAPISILLFSSALNSSMESFISQRVMINILFDIRIKNQVM